MLRDPFHTHSVQAAVLRGSTTVLRSRGGRKYTTETAKESQSKRTPSVTLRNTPAAFRRQKYLAERQRTEA